MCYVSKNEAKGLKLLSLLVILVSILTSCSSTKISGKFINEKNSDVYIKFNKDKSVSLYLEDQSVAHGTYEIDKETNFVSVLFVSGQINDVAMFLLHENGKSISVFGDVTATNTYINGTFIKEKSFWDKYWWAIIIVVCVLGALSERAGF